MPLNLFNPLLTSIDLLSGTRWSPFANLVADDLPHDDDGDDIYYDEVFVRRLGTFYRHLTWVCTKSFALSLKNRIFSTKTAVLTPK